MRLRRFAQTCAARGTLALAVALSTPALAHDEHHHEPGIAPGGPDHRPVWKEDGAPPQPQHYAMDPRARADWLADCRRRTSDNGFGGAVIGGLAGGVIGNRVAGHGNRTVGTAAGAAVGVVAGAVIDKEEDRGRVNDECDAYLDRYIADYGRSYGYGYPAQGYAYAVPMIMVPVMMQPKRDCTETVVIEESVTAPARRNIPPRIRRAPDKRIRIVPDKRVRVQ